jgi:membrane protease YdiL (CAAX protease family)
MHRGRERLVALAEVVLCSSLPTQLAIAILLAGAGMAPRTEGGQLSLPYICTVTIADTILLIALMTFFTRRRGESVAGLWLGSRPIAREAGLGLALIPPVFVLVVVLLNGLKLVAPWLHNVEVNPLEQLATGGPFDALLFGVVVILAGGVREELVRAFLLRRFEQDLGGATVGVIVLSVAFGLGHVDQGWDAVITTGALGAFWALVYLRRRSSVAPMISHAGFNSLEVIRIALGASG